MFYEDQTDDTGTVYRDAIMLALVGFLVIIFIILPHINPKGVSNNEELTSKPPGSVIIELYWGDGLDADVDLWVQGPGDVPVGYSNKGGGLFNLLRDDLGKQMDITEKNYENSYSRGALPGKYIVNLHLFRNRTQLSEIECLVVVSVRKGETGRARQILSQKLFMDREGEERTVFQFELDDEGGLKPETVTTLQKAIRSGSKP